MERADALTAASRVALKTLPALSDIIEAYKRQRWPDGKIPGGMG